MPSISPADSPLRRLQALYRGHTDFILLLILFITFRILALAAYRPGGLVLDFSDFYWYRGFAELTRQGYYPYDTLWTTYPPLFPFIMIAIYQLSALIPPWEHANLWFTLLLGGFFLLFEIGNFVLLYLFALKVEEERSYESPISVGTSDSPSNTISNSSFTIHNSSFKIHNSLRPAWIYAALFVPVYTLTGWFESYPLFFFLLSLYLLLKNRPYLSAFFTGIGFMIKLIPLILVPVAVQLVSKTKYQLSIINYQLSINKLPQNTLEFETENKPKTQNPKLKTQNPKPRQRHASEIQNSSFKIQNSIIPLDPPRIALYAAIFFVTVILIGLPFYFMNPDLIFGPQQITGARQPWETVWALIDGNYDYGVIPLDMRDLAWTPGDAPPTRIPWLWVTVIFGLTYAVFYTRPLNWQLPQNILAFVGFTLCLFMLWSKGYSPQWLGWPLFFIALLLPNLRGIIYAVVLSIANIIEANFFFIIFPQERWLFVVTVLIRTLLLIVLAVEFLWLIWPPSLRVRKIRDWGVAAFVALLIIGAIPGGVQLGRSYVDLRRQQSPYAATITRLQNEQVTGALLLNSHTVYDWFYPYLRHNYTLFMLDDYAPANDSVERRTTELLDGIAAQTDVLWIYDADAAVTTSSEETLTAWLNNRPPAHIQDIDGGRLYLFILK